VQTAIKNEVMVAISNRNYAGPGNMLDIWMDNVQRAGVKNAMVIALDPDTRQHVQSKAFPVIEMHEKVLSPLICLHRCYVSGLTQNGQVLPPHITQLCRYVT
jgi:hypothetical protein